MTQAPPRIAAVIPHWNRSDLLRRLLASVKRQSRPFDQMVVADNGSTDDSAQVAAEAGARFLALGRNLGFAAAVNRGIAATEADWLAILNNDVTLEPGWLAALLAAAEAETPAAWFATGRILSAADPERIDGTFDEISRGACACRCGAGRRDGAVWEQPRRIRIAPMTAALFRRTLFDRVGGLDEAFGSYLEDVDFGLRCALAGCSGVYVPSAVAQHQGGATSGPWTKDTVRRIARNQVLLAAKHFRGQPRWPIVAGQLLWGGVALRHGRGLAYLRGKVDGLRAARKLGQNRTPPERLAAVVEESERQILEVQRQAGFDSYWRAYFWLSGR
jgi:hypothetical protein